MTQATDNLSGEARLRSRRNRFWTFCIMGFAVAIVAGFVTGYAANLFGDGVLPSWSLFLLWGITQASFTWFTWSYFRRIDELDLLDNLWAALVAFYFYFVAMPSWWLFHDVGLAPEVDHLAIYFATAVVMFATYVLRKLGLR
ncbi:MAG: hypothetical protein WA957_08585 [Alteraurantiacibacter sp.]